MKLPFDTIIIALLVEFLTVLNFVPCRVTFLDVHIYCAVSCNDVNIYINMYLPHLYFYKCMYLLALIDIPGQLYSQIPTFCVLIMVCNFTSYCLF